MQLTKTIQKSFRLISTEVYKNAIDYILATGREYKDNNDVETVITVQVMNKDRARSVAQNSLYWQWVTIISNKYGNTKDEQHAILKRAHLVKIYQRDDPQTAETVIALNQAKMVMSDQKYERLAKGVAKLFSTTKATTKQMAEYLNDIYYYYSANGLVLPQPDDYNWITHDE